MGNKVSSTTKSFKDDAPKNFLVLDGKKNLSFFTTVQRTTQYPSLTDVEVSAMGNSNIAKDSQLFEVKVGLNWFVVGPLIAFAVTLLCIILYYGSSHRRVDPMA